MFVTFTLVFLIYLALSANLELSNVIVGVLIGVGLVALIRPARQLRDIKRLPKMALALIKFLFILVWDLVVSGVQVATIAFSPNLKISQGIIAIPSKLHSNLGLAITAHAITLTPGELVLEMDENVMYVHCLDATKAVQYTADIQKMQKDVLCDLLFDEEGGEHV